MNNIEQYFSGEKRQCSIGAAMAIAGMLFGVWGLWFSGAAIYKGMAYVVIPLSLFLFIICIGVVVRTSHDISRVNKLYSQGHEAIQPEVRRMEKVLSNFKTVKIAELCFVAAGIIIFWLLGNKGDAWKGIAFALMIEGALLFLFDHFAQARGNTYMEFLRNWSV